MATPDFTLGAGDKSPFLEETLFQPGTVTPVDLTGATITIRLAPRDRSTPAVVEAVTIAGVPTDGNVLWQPLGTYAAGFWDYQWIVLLPGALPASWPTDPDHVYKTMPISARLI